MALLLALPSDLIAFVKDMAVKKYAPRIQGILSDHLTGRQRTLQLGSSSRGVNFFSAICRLLMYEGSFLTRFSDFPISADSFVCAESASAGFELRSDFSLSIDSFQLIKAMVLSIAIILNFRQVRPLSERKMLLRQLVRATFYLKRDALPCLIQSPPLILNKGKDANTGASRLAGSLQTLELDGYLILVRGTGVRSTLVPLFLPRDSVCA